MGPRRWRFGERGGVGKVCLRAAARCTSSDMRRLTPSLLSHRGRNSDPAAGPGLVLYCVALAKANVPLPCSVGAVASAGLLPLSLCTGLTSGLAGCVSPLLTWPQRAPATRKSSAEQESQSSSHRSWGPNVALSWAREPPLGSRKPPGVSSHVYGCQFVGGGGAVSLQGPAG